MFKELTDAEIEEIDRKHAELQEMRDAASVLKRRADRDAKLLVLLEMGCDSHTQAGKYAHPAALEAARAINGEAP